MIKGFRSGQRLASKLVGLTESQSQDEANYVTLQEFPGRRHGIDTVNHGVYMVGTAQTVLAGSNIRVISATGHGAVRGDVIRFTSGTISGLECGVLSVVDVNTFTTTVELSVDPTGLTFQLLRYVTPLYDATGALAVGAPVGGATSAKQDIQITQETAINTVLGLQNDTAATTDTGTFSIVAFIKRSMQNWTALLAKLPALVAGRIPIDGSGVTQPVSGTFWQATQPVSGSVTANIGTTNGLALDSSLTALNAKDFATQTTLALIKAKTDNLDVALSTTALKSQFPTTIGQTTKALSISAAVPSDQATQTAPFGIRESDGTNWISSIALAASQLTSGALSAIRMGATICMGWDGTTHRELAVDTTGNQKVIMAANTPTYNESLIVGFSGVTTITAPAGAKGCKVITPLANSSYLNITLDGTTAPSSTVGMEIQNGRSEDFIGVGASLKAICTDGISTGQKISVHWYV